MSKQHVYIDRKIIWVGGKPQLEPYWRGYVRHYARELFNNFPYYFGKFIGFLATIVFGSVCGIVAMAGFPGILCAALVAALLTIPFWLFYQGNRGAIHPIVPALFIIFFVVMPLAFFCLGEGIDSPLAFAYWFYELNITAFQMSFAPFLEVLDDVISFTAELFGHKPQAMKWVFLAADDWNRGVVMAYHLLIIAPTMIMMFYLGFLKFKQEESIEGRIKIVMYAVVPAFWVWFFLREGIKSAKAG